MQQNLDEAKLSLTDKPLKATSAERFLILNEWKSMHKDLPQPLRFSHTLSYLLSHVSVPLAEYDLIAGRCVDCVLTDNEESLFQAYLKHPDYPARGLFWPSGHCTYSWETVVEQGLVGLKAKAVSNLKKVTSPDKKIFLTSLIEIYDSIIAYTLRYAEAAKIKGMTETASNLYQAATSRPTGFASALQLLWIITLINCAYVSENPTLTLGRLDQILYPLYKADIENGTLTPEKAKNYITDYYCKHNLIMGRGEHQVGDAANSTTFARITNFDAPQYLLLAGTDDRGKLAVNDLTRLFAECIVPEFKNPVVVVRYVKGMDKKAPDLWQTLCSRALASSSLMFYNDNNVYATLRRIGLPNKDARSYAHFGCNWCSPGANGAWMLSGPSSRLFDAFTCEDEAKQLIRPYMRTNSEHGWPEDFVIVMNELAKLYPETVTIDDFYNMFFARMSDFIDRKLAYLAHELEARQRKPSAVVTFGDCFFTDSIKNAECFAAGAKYHFELQAFQMFGTVADCFIAVDQLVMIEKKLTLKQLADAVAKNFDGYPEVLALCRNADKYGMNTPLSDKHTRRLSHTASDLVIEKNKPYFDARRLFLVPCMQSDTWHLKYGETFGATPDGRLAFTPFSQNMRPTNGVCTNGITAMFNSLLQLPSDGLTSGALNLDIEADRFADQNGKRIFAALLASYFNQGGLHAQVTCTNVDQLTDAQKNPHLHKDLRVRVTGYSGIFVDFCKRLQDDIINRFK